MTCCGLNGPVSFIACSKDNTWSSNPRPDGGVVDRPCAERLPACRFLLERLFGPRKLPMTSSSESLRLMLSIGPLGLELYVVGNFSWGISGRGLGGPGLSSRNMSTSPLDE